MDSIQFINRKKSDTSKYLVNSTTSQSSFKLNRSKLPTFYNSTHTSSFSPFNQKNKFNLTSSIQDCNTKQCDKSFLQVKMPYYKQNRYDTIKVLANKNINVSNHHKLLYKQKSSQSRLHKFLKKNQGNSIHKTNEQMAKIKRNYYDLLQHKNYSLHKKNKKDSNKQITRLQRQHQMSYKQWKVKTIKQAHKCEKISKLDCYNQQFEKFLRNNNLQLLKRLEYIVGRSAQICDKLQTKIIQAILQYQQHLNKENTKNDRKLNQYKIKAIISKYVPVECIDKIYRKYIRKYHHKTLKNKNIKYRSLNSSPIKNMRKINNKGLPVHESIEQIEKLNRLEIKRQISIQNDIKAKNHTVIRDIQQQQQTKFTYKKQQQFKNLCNLKRKIKKFAINKIISKNTSSIHMQPVKQPILKIQQQYIDDSYAHIQQTQQQNAQTAKKYVIKKNSKIKKFVNFKGQSYQDTKNHNSSRSTIKQNLKYGKNRKIIVPNKKYKTNKQLKFHIDQELSQCAYTNRSLRSQKRITSSKKIIILNQLQLKNNNKSIQKLIGGLKFDKSDKMNQMNLASIQKQTDKRTKDYLKSPSRSHHTIKTHSVFELQNISNKTKKDEIMQKSEKYSQNFENQPIKTRKQIILKKLNSKPNLRRLKRTKTNFTNISNWQQIDIEPSCKTISYDYHEILHQIQSSHQISHQIIKKRKKIKQKVVYQKDQELQMLKKQIQQKQQNQQQMKMILQSLQMIQLLIKQNDSLLTIKRKLRQLKKIYKSDNFCQQKYQTLFKYIKNIANLYKLASFITKQKQVNQINDQSAQINQKQLKYMIQNNKSSIYQFFKIPKQHLFHPLLDHAQIHDNNIYPDEMGPALKQLKCIKINHRQQDIEPIKTSHQYLGKIISYVTEKQRTPFQFYYNKGIMDMILAAKFGHKVHKCKDCYIDQYGKWVCHRNKQTKQNLDQAFARNQQRKQKQRQVSFQESYTSSDRDNILPKKDQLNSYSIENISSKIINNSTNKSLQKQSMRASRRLLLIQQPLQAKSKLDNYLYNLF